MPNEVSENSDEMNYIDQLETQLQEQNLINKKLQNASVGMYMQDDNLIKWQLNLAEELNKIYHLLRGDEVEEDEKGNERYIPQTNVEVMILNNFGVQIIMNILSFYLNRNTILSFYDEEMINIKIRDFGIEVSDLIFNRYEDMMMTTDFRKEFEKIFNCPLIKTASGNFYYTNDGKCFLLTDYMIETVNQKLNEHLMGKIKMYPMLVKELVDTVHSAYMRAYRGRELTSLREARNVTQSEMIGSKQNYQVVQQKKRRTMNPFTWF